MTIRQQKALAALASGLTLREAATVGGYANLESVCRLAKSDVGKTYLEDIAAKVDAETVFSIQDRLEKLKSIARVNQFSDPKLALGAVREANRLIR